jgi:hypothetical protein
MMYSECASFQRGTNRPRRTDGWFVYMTLDCDMTLNGEVWSPTKRTKQWEGLISERILVHFRKSSSFVWIIIRRSRDTTSAVILLRQSKRTINTLKMH